MKNQIIHIGMPRTATTFFQQRIFPQLNGYEFYGLEETHFHDAFNQLLFADDSFYNEEEVLEFTKDWKDKNIILSNENFVGQAYNLNFINRSLIANRLSHIFPDAKILIVLRNQIDLLASLYSISLLWRETKSIDEYLWSPSKKEATNFGPASLKFNTHDDYENIIGYDYYSLIELYKKNFSNVEVLLFEDFIYAPESFSSKLDHFFEVGDGTFYQLIKNSKPIHESINTEQAKKLRQLNKYQKLFSSGITSRIIANLKRTILKKKTNGKKPSFSNDKLTELKNHFGPLNKKLAESYPEIGIQTYHKEYYF